MNLASAKDIKKILEAEGFSFKKSLGQNFIIDAGVCPKMAESCTGEEIGILEIGPGAGVLTAELSKRAKKVVAVELDERLKPILEKTVGNYNNTEIVFGDAMKLDLKALIEEKFFDCKQVNVCANLPYYITSPIIMMLLESRLPITSVTAMVQKEAAERLCAKVGSRDSGAVTAAVSFYAEGEILFGVPRTSFLPPPNVDSVVIRLKIRENPPVNPKCEKFFFSVIKGAFSQRRKTLANALSSALGIEKEKIYTVLDRLNLDPAVRGEKLTLQNFSDISDLLYEYR